MKKVSYFLVVLSCIMLGFTSCGENGPKEGGNMKRVAAAFYYGENLFPGMEYFSLRFTSGTLDLNQDPVVGTGDVIVLDIFSECQDGMIFPKEGVYTIVDMERIENGYAMAGANYSGSNLGCYLMFAEDGEATGGDYIPSGTIKIEGTPDRAVVTANVELEILGESRTYKYVGPLAIKDLSEK